MIVRSKVTHPCGHLPDGRALLKKGDNVINGPLTRSQSEFIAALIQSGDAEIIEEASSPAEGPAAGPAPTDISVSVAKLDVPSATSVSSLEPRTTRSRRGKRQAGAA